MYWEGFFQVRVCDQRTKDGRWPLDVGVPAEWTELSLTHERVGLDSLVSFQMDDATTGPRQSTVFPTVFALFFAFLYWTSMVTNSHVSLSRVVPRIHQLKSLTFAEWNAIVKVAHNIIFWIVVNCSTPPRPNRRHHATKWTPRPTNRWRSSVT